jgi:hypothetical protein
MIDAQPKQVFTAPAFAYIPPATTTTFRTPEGHSSNTWLRQFRRN